MSTAHRHWITAAVAAMATAGAVILSQPAPHDAPIDPAELLPLDVLDLASLQILPHGAQAPGRSSSNCCTR